MLHVFYMSVCMTLAILSQCSAQDATAQSESKKPLLIGTEGVEMGNVNIVTVRRERLEIKTSLQGINLVGLKSVMPYQEAIRFFDLLFERLGKKVDLLIYQTEKAENENAENLIKFLKSKHKGWGINVIVFPPGTGAKGKELTAPELFEKFLTNGGLSANPENAERSFEAKGKSQLPAPPQHLSGSLKVRKKLENEDRSNKRE